MWHDAPETTSQKDEKYISPEKKQQIIDALGLI